MKRKIASIAAAAAGLVIAANAASVIPVTGVLASGSGNYSGDTTKMTDGSGMNGNGTSGGPLTGDPSTWTATTNAYQAEWQSAGNTSGVLYTPTSANNKMGWGTFNLGSSQSLNELFIWNVRNGTTTEIRNYNIYFADTALNLPGSSSKVDYDFSVANGWSSFGSFTMAATQLTLGNGAEAVHDVSGNSAQYIGIEIITNNGNYTDNGNGTASGRVGLAEFAVTAPIPEPSAALLGSLGTLLLLRRRK
jgi:hypothetical protein